MTRIHICYEFKEGPWGGGNQFLQTFRKWCRDASLYAENPSDADAIVFNSHHMIDRVAKLRRAFPGKLFIHRIDGPIHLVRGRDSLVDRIVHAANTGLADGTVFQSEWSRRENIRCGMRCSGPWVVVHNTAEPSLFHPAGDYARAPDARIRIVISSWSSNRRKGFDVYEYLDTHLDFTKYQVSFIGNTESTFVNLQTFPPMDSTQLARTLRAHDIYLTASVDDPCSNSLIEAIQCGLLPVCRQSGGHPELTAGQGVLFHDTDDVLAAIDQASSRVSSAEFQRRALRPRVAAEEYYEFIARLRRDGSSLRQRTALSGVFNHTKLRFWMVVHRAYTRFNLMAS